MVSKIPGIVSLTFHLWSNVSYIFEQWHGMAPCIGNGVGQCGPQGKVLGYWKVMYRPKVRPEWACLCITQKADFSLVVLELFSKYCMCILQPSVATDVGLNHRLCSCQKLCLSKISYLMFTFITGYVNHFGLDILFGFLLLCIKQWLEKGFFFSPPKGYF